MILPFKIDIATLPIISRKGKGRHLTIDKYPVIFGIYKITSPNGSVYIGLSNDVYLRIHSCYRLMSCKGQKKIYHSLKKYSVENHTFEIIHILKTDDLSKSEIISELNKLEAHYVLLFNSYSDDNKFGLNLTRGGDSMELTQETWDRINNSKKGRKQSPETVEKRAGKLRGRKAYPQTIAAAIKANTDIVRSPETRQKLREANLGKKQSPETIKKRVDSKKANNKPMSEEHRKKIGDSKRGDKNPHFGKPSHNRGKKMSDESRQKMSIAQRGRIPWNKGIPMSEEAKMKSSKTIKATFAKKKSEGKSHKEK